jgi:23S rRNA pseudouridine1911/1915/1917 synthase
MVFAKNPKSAAALSASAAGGGMKKEYLAVVEGVPAQQAAKLHDLLFFDRQRDKTFVVDRMRRGVKEASLSYELVATRAPDESCPVALSLLRVRLESGRTHQIRAQFASRRLPLYGDARYGAKTRGELGLFAATLSFPHPKTRQALSFSATPPAALPFSLFGGEPIVQK